MALKGNKSDPKKKVAGDEGAKGSVYRDEIILVATLVTAILLLLSNFNLCGVVGKWISFLLFGLFGMTAYIFPILLFFAVAFSISNRSILNAKVKLCCSVALFFILTGLLNLMKYGYNKDTNPFAYYKLSAESHSGGGLIGGLISKLLCSLFGKLGAYAIFAGVIIVLLMFITEKFVFAGLKERRRKNEKPREKKIVKQNLPENEEEEQKALPTKRKSPAKVFTFTKEDKKQTVTNQDFLFEIPEPNADLVNLSIHRGYERMEPYKEDDKPIYETELNSKFKTQRYQEDLQIADEEPVVKETLPKKAKKVLSLFRPEKQEEELQPVDHTVPMTIKEEEAKDPPIVLEDIKIEEVKDKPNKEKLRIERETQYKEQIKEQILEEKAYQKPEIPKEEKQQQDGLVSGEINKAMEMKPKKKYEFPSLELLTPPKVVDTGMKDEELRETAAKLKSTLDSFGVKVEMKNVSCGPAVTRYELQPAQGVKVSKITALTDDIKLSLAAADIRIEAPIPGKSAVGIEVPNKKVSMVYLRSLLESREFSEHASSIAFAVGKDIGGNTVVTDIAKMPHLLIAGATGSGKSVCINTLIMSILYKAHPDDVKLIMVDPKVVELSVYNGIPHLLIPVVTDPKKASGALNWAVAEMGDRYKKFADLGVRDIKGYNAKVAPVQEDNNQRFQKMPQIVIIVDELADLMMVAPGEVEDAICRLAQLARAAGIHLIIATQRPSVNVITGLIKANVPSRVAFAVSSTIDSRTILDGGGAEKLLGNGDMLFFPSGYPKPVRVQGSYVSDKEVGQVVEFLTAQFGEANYSNEIDQKIVSQTISDSGQVNGANDRDDYFVEAGKFIIEKDKASIGMLQRVYKIGFNRAARIMDQLYDAGVVGPEEGTKPRKIIMSMEEFEEYVDEYV